MLTSTAWCWLSTEKTKKNLSERVKKISKQYYKTEKITFKKDKNVPEKCKKNL